MIITIDGPSGVGKSTVSKAVAEKTGCIYLDTGAMYRAIALKTATSGIDIGSETELSKLLDSTSVGFRRNPDGGLSILLDGEDVAASIRSPEISRLSSDVATKRPVRVKLVAIQREIGSSGNIVAEGRDMGTYVFPGADFKFYLTATTEERARRRWAQLREAGREADLAEVERELLTRDRQDSERAESPLHPSPNAVIIDTTNLLTDEVISRIISAVQG
ncbi:MAG: (d)CMP kinase [Candidatus Dadabacteria bacterium]|nr:(d)CMP kinase [Candidatus Dadabacteria bacterium]